MAFTPALSATEMLYEAKVLYESIASADAPGYTNLQWSILLTRAQHNVVTRLWEEGYDKDEVHRGALSTLLNTTSSTTRTNKPWVHVNAWEFTVDTNIMFTYSERASYVKGITTYYADVIPVEWDYYKMNVDNPFECPDGSYFWGLIGGNTSTVYAKTIITDGNTPASLITTGLHFPEPIIVNVSVTLQGVTGLTDCKLHPAVHRDIVENAANLASAYSKDQVGYQILQNEMNNE
jgi:hypothetical protein